MKKKKESNENAINKKPSIKDQKFICQLINRLNTAEVKTNESEYIWREYAEIESQRKKK